MAKQGSGSLQGASESNPSINKGQAKVGGTSLPWGREYQRKRPRHLYHRSSGAPRLSGEFFPAFEFQS